MLNSIQIKHSFNKITQPYPSCVVKYIIFIYKILNDSVNTTATFVRALQHSHFIIILLSYCIFGVLRPFAMYALHFHND